MNETAGGKIRTLCRLFSNSFELIEELVFRPKKEKQRLKFLEANKKTRDEELINELLKTNFDYPSEISRNFETNLQKKDFFKKAIKEAKQLSLPNSQNTFIKMPPKNDLQKSASDIILDRSGLEKSLTITPTKGMQESQDNMLDLLSGDSSTSIIQQHMQTTDNLIRLLKEKKGNLSTIMMDELSNSFQKNNELVGLLTSRLESQGIRIDSLVRE